MIWFILAMIIVAIGALITILLTFNWMSKQKIDIQIRPRVRHVQYIAIPFMRMPDPFPMMSPYEEIAEERVSYSEMRYEVLTAKSVVKTMDTERYMYLHPMQARQSNIHPDSKLEQIIKSEKRRLVAQLEELVEVESFDPEDMRSFDDPFATTHELTIRALKRM